MNTDTWSWLDGEMSFIPTNERIFLPCSCCGKSMVKGTQCITCKEKSEHSIKRYITIFHSSMVAAAVLTMVLL